MLLNIRTYIYICLAVVSFHHPWTHVSGHIFKPTSLRFGKSARIPKTMLAKIRKLYSRSKSVAWKYSTSRPGGWLESENVPSGWTSGYSESKRCLQRFLMIPPYKLQCWMMVDGFGLYCPLGNIDGFVMTCVALTLEVHLALIGLRREDTSEILVNFVRCLSHFVQIRHVNGPRCMLRSAPRTKGQSFAWR